MKWQGEDITPEGGLTEGQELEITYRLDAEVLDLSELTLTLKESDDSTTEKRGADLTKTDNGDGTWDYSYTHRVKRYDTGGTWTLDSEVQGHDAENFYYTAEAKNA